MWVGMWEGKWMLLDMERCGCCVREERAGTVQRRGRQEAKQYGDEIIVGERNCAGAE